MLACPCIPIAHTPQAICDSSAPTCQPANRDTQPVVMRLYSAREMLASPVTTHRPTFPRKDRGPGVQLYRVSILPAIDNGLRNRQPGRPLPDVHDQPTFFFLSFKRLGCDTPQRKMHLELHFPPPPSSAIQRIPSALGPRPRLARPTRCLTICKTCVIRKATFYATGKI